MFKRIWRARFSSKYAANLLIILFIVRSVASLIESDVSGGIGNATASLRLTRQKVLIQAIRDPENWRGIRLKKGKHGTDNQDDNTPPDIVVEEFRIKAKIHFPAPRTCKDLLTDFSKDKKFRSRFSSSRNRRLIYCHAESLKRASKNEKRSESKSSTQPSKHKSISSSNNSELQKNFLSEVTYDFLNKKFTLNDTEKKYVTSGEFIEKPTEKLKNSIIAWKNEENRKIDGNEEFLQNDLLQFYGTSKSKKKMNSSENKKSEYSETKKEEFRQEDDVNFKPEEFNTFGSFHENIDEYSPLNENFKLQKIESTENEEEMENTDLLPFFDDHKIVGTKNNELGLSSASYDSEKKLHKLSARNTKISQPCHEKPKTINMTDYFAPLQLNNRKEKISVDQFSTSHHFSEKFDNEKFAFHRRERRSLKVPNNSTHVSNNPKKVPKKAGKSGKMKKHNLENTPKKSENEVAKSSVRKTRNSTENKINLEKQSNNTMWNLTMPPVFTQYFSFLRSFLKPFIDIRAANNIQLLTPGQETKTKNKVARFSEETLPKNVSMINNSIIVNINVTKTGFPNSTEIITPNSTEIIFPSFTEINFHVPTENNSSTSTEINFPNMEKNDFSNSTENNFQNSEKKDFSSSTGINVLNLEKNDSSNSTENNFQNSEKKDFSSSTGINVLNLEKNDSSNSTENNFQNSEKKDFSNSTGINVLNLEKNDISNSTGINVLNLEKNNFSNSTEINFPNVEKNEFSNSTEFNFLNVEKNDLPTSTEINLLNSTKSNIAKLAEINFSNFTSTTSTILPQSKPALKIIRNHSDINFDDKFPDTKPNESNLTNSLKSSTESENIFNNSSPNDQTTDLPSKTEKNLADKWNASTENNEGQKSEIGMSVTKIPSNGTEISSTISNEVTSEKPDDFQERAILNFTGIAPNRTDSIVLNTLPNNSANQSVNIGEVISTYPTLRRYSRNDTLEETVSEKPKITDARNNDAKNRQTKNSLNDSYSPKIVRKSHGNRGRKRSRYKGKMQQPFSGNSLPRVGKQSWRTRNNLSVTSTPSVTSTSTLPTVISTLPAEISDSLDSGELKKSTSPTILEKLPEFSLPTILKTLPESSLPIFFEKLPESSLPTISKTLPESSLSTVLVPTEQPDSANKSIVSDYVTQVSEKEEFNISASTEIMRNEILHPMGSTSVVYKLSENKELETSTVPLETSADLNFKFHSTPSKEIVTYFSAEKKSNESVAINDNLKKTFMEFSTLPYDKSVFVDPLVKNKSDNSIIPSEPNIKSDENFGNTKIEEITKSKVSGSPSILGISETPKTILPVESKLKHEQIVKNTVNGENSKFSNHELKTSSLINGIELLKWNQTAKKITEEDKKIPEEVDTSSSPVKVIEESVNKNSQNTISKMKSIEYFVEKQLNHLDNSTYLPEKNEENVDGKSTTEFNLLIRKEEEETIKASKLKTTNPEVLEALGNIQLNASSERPKDIISKDSYSSLDNTTDNSVTINSDINQEMFSSKTEFLIASPTTTASSVKRETNGTEILARIARDTRTSPEYEGPEEIELDYEIDSFGGNEPVTEDMPTTEGDNVEGLKGASTQKNPPFGVNLPHSAVHGIFFKDKKATEEAIPDLHQYHYFQSLPVSTAESLNSLNVPIEFPDNLTNNIDAPELPTLVKGLEEFLFDDSVTGTSDRKQLLKNQDLDVESSNRNFETRSAIFEPKKLSVNKKNDRNGKKVDGLKNWRKTKRQESTKERISNLLSSAKRIRPKTNRKMRKIITDKENEKRKKGKKASLKTKMSRNFKKQSTSKIRRASENGRYSNKRMLANYW